MGDFMFDVGDLVTRKSYDNDIVFRIIEKRDDVFILKGLFVRLFADSPREDLKILDIERVDTLLNEYSSEYSSLN